MSDARQAYRALADRVPVLGDVDAALQVAGRRRRWRRAGTAAGAATLALCIAVAVVRAPWDTAATGSHPSTTPRPTPPTQVSRTPGPYESTCRLEGGTGCRNIVGHVPSRLVRPLRFAQLRPGQACPTTRATEVDTPYFGGHALVAPGPVRPIIAENGAARGVAIVSMAGGGFQVKMLWYSAARYHGPVLIRAERLDGPGPVSISFRGARSSWMLVNSKTPVSSPGPLRTWPTGTYGKAPGCYGFQADGTTFSYDLVLRVEARPS